jgi:serine/threonine protein phosphatase PrpC
MDDSKNYIDNLFRSKGIVVPSNRNSLFEEFVIDEINKQLVSQILDNQIMITDSWKLKNRIKDIQLQPLTIPNATVEKLYDACLDLKKNRLDDIIYCELVGLEGTGLSFDEKGETISGTPLQSGDIKLALKFRISGETENSVLNEKVISLIINPDPKSLWKNLQSNENDPYWKEDNLSEFQSLGQKHIVVSSKRGRSHANVAGFRDDDFAYKYFEKTGWSIISVADGAGSAQLARKGSALACKSVVSYFEENFTEAILSEFDDILLEYKNGTGEDVQKKLSFFIYNHLSKAAHFAHKQIEFFALDSKNSMKDFHSTLIFALFKKYEFGYAILSFGVGDCPIALLNSDLTEVSLMNWLDVGEYGGGTRFITMPEIFQSDKFTTRFKFKFVDDFSFLMLMTDGIYDPKFIVEANLEKVEKWQDFVKDLNGDNSDGLSVTFNPKNAEIANELSKWMDFWSPGNHDDRTLAIVF